MSAIKKLTLAQKKAVNTAISDELKNKPFAERMKLANKIKNGNVGCMSGTITDALKSI